MTSALSHALRILDLAGLQVLIVAENSEGDRFWSANGKLGGEFVNEGKIENREWKMFQIKDDEICPSTFIGKTPDSNLKTAEDSDQSDISKVACHYPPSTNTSSKKDVLCFKCHKRGHKNWECQSLIKNTTSLDNTKSQNKKLSGNKILNRKKFTFTRKTDSVSEIKKVFCWYCRNASHCITECALKPPGTVHCRFCFRLGHWQFECPLLLKKKRIDQRSSPNEPEGTSHSSSLNEPEEIDQSSSIHGPEEEPTLCYAQAQARRREELLRRISGSSEARCEENEPIPGLNLAADSSRDEKSAVVVKEERD